MLGLGVARWGLSRLSTVTRFQTEHHLSHAGFGPRASSSCKVSPAGFRPATPTLWASRRLHSQSLPAPSLHAKLGGSPPGPTRPRGSSLCSTGVWSLVPGATPHPGGVAWAPSPPCLGGRCLVPRAACHCLPPAGRLGATVKCSSAQAQGGKEGDQRARGGARREGAMEDGGAEGEGHPQGELRPRRDGYRGEIGGHLQGMDGDLGDGCRGKCRGTCGGC